VRITKVFPYEARIILVVISLAFEFVVVAVAIAPDDFAIGFNALGLCEDMTILTMNGLFEWV
jgi:hypothetical protein